jgi:hypothetical protein
LATRLSTDRPDEAAGGESRRLRDVATRAFYDYVLPEVRARMPHIADSIVVSITSSVAYGVADAYSDLDVFITFLRHRDYVRYASGLSELIDGLRWPDWYATVCDKGVRFELESLSRSDIARTYRSPHRPDYWMEQTDWLMSWFGSGIPIYDPSRIRERFDRRCRFYPPRIANWRLRGARIRVVKASRRTSELLAANPDLTFEAARSAWRAVTAALDAAYLVGGSYGPHPKWRRPLANRLLAHSGDALRVVAALDVVADSIRTATSVDQLDDRLVELVQTVPVPLDDADGADLARTALTFREPCGRHSSVVSTVAIPESLERFVLDLAAEGTATYLPDELGVSALLRWNGTYDVAMRVCDMLRWLVANGVLDTPLPVQVTSESRSVKRRRSLYYNFLIWRKLRVVEKALRRDQPFNFLWYMLQVAELLLEVIARLQDGFRPPEHQYAREVPGLVASSPVAAGELGELLLVPAALRRGIDEPDWFLGWGWRMYRDIRDHLVRAGELPDAAARDPLATQWDVEYWKYENLFV